MEREDLFLLFYQPDAPMGRVQYMGRLTGPAVKKNFFGYGFLWNIRLKKRKFDLHPSLQ